MSAIVLAPPRSSAPPRFRLRRRRPGVSFGQDGLGQEGGIGPSIGAVISSLAPIATATIEKRRAEKLQKREVKLAQAQQLHEAELARAQLASAELAADAAREARTSRLATVTRIALIAGGSLALLGVGIYAWRRRRRAAAARGGRR